MSGRPHVHDLKPRVERTEPNRKQKCHWEGGGQSLGGGLTVEAAHGSPSTRLSWGRPTAQSPEKLSWDLVLAGRPETLRTVMLELIQAGLHHHLGNRQLVAGWTARPWWKEHFQKMALAAGAPLMAERKKQVKRSLSWTQRPASYRSLWPWPGPAGR